VIEDARQRQRRRQRRIALLALLASLAGIAYVAGGGSGGGTGGVRHTANGPWPRVSAGNGIRVSYPVGWHLYAPPVTSLSYPSDRLLITSYPARTGGSCSPTRAEAALPAAGALIYLFEYDATATPALSRPKATAFASQPRRFTLTDSGNYECWMVPTYLIRFRAAGRLFQAQVALGPHATPRRRAQALRVLDSIRVQTSTR
jgi:hypothetical protein